MASIMAWHQIGGKPSPNHRCWCQSYTRLKKAKEFSLCLLGISSVTRKNQRSGDHPVHARNQSEPALQCNAGTDLLMIGPKSHGNGPHFLNHMSYLTKSSLSSRLLFEKLIDWVIYVDIVYQCWKSCDKSVSCKQITEGFEHHRCCKSWFKRSSYCIGFHDGQNHNELMIKK